MDLLGSASYLRVVATAGAPTDAEIAAVRVWLIADSKVKTILLRRLTHVPSDSLHAQCHSARGPGRSFTITVTAVTLAAVIRRQL
jgi:hypothetical protein